MTNEPSRLALTIVTPSFMMGRHIEATLESVRSQGYSNLQHKVVDGAPLRVQLIPWWRRVREERVRYADGH